MNKHERAEIKAIILAQIASLSEEIPHLENTAGAKLRLERLDTALRRVDADNFGECFKCEKPIPATRLRIFPENMLCADCLEGPAG